MNESIFRIGQGYDVHALVPGRPLIVGGVSIPFQTGLLGHSDADVLLHAITDALLGAAGMGDIGSHFPDSDLRWHGANSRALLRETMSMLDHEGWKVVNVDATIIAQQPRMSPYVSQMRVNLANDLDIPLLSVNIKAKTNERLGFEGRSEGLVAQAIILIMRKQIHQP